MTVPPTWNRFPTTFEEMLVACREQASWEAEHHARVPVEAAVILTPEALFDLCAVMVELRRTTEETTTALNHQVTLLNAVGATLDNMTRFELAFPLRKWKLRRKMRDLYKTAHPPDSPSIPPPPNP